MGPFSLKHKSGQNIVGVCAVVKIIMTMLRQVWSKLFNIIVSVQPSFGFWVI